MLLLVIDARPLENDHRHRGIGYYVRGLITSLARAGLRGWTPLVDTRNPQPASPSRAVGVWRPKSLQYHGGWVLDEIQIPLKARVGGWTAFHSTDPRSVPDPRFVRTISTVYDLTPLRDTVTWRALSLDQRFAYRRGLGNARRADAIVTISHAVKSELVAELEVPPSKVHVVYPGIDLEEWSDRLATGTSRHGLVFVGAPAPHKNLDVVLAALAILPAARRPPLTVVGPWSDNNIAGLTRRSRELGIAPVTVEPFASPARLRELYRTSAALVMPSRMEGFGIPVLEAMASGCPTIASDLPVLHEIGGAVPLFAPAGDAPTWADLIDGLVGDAGERARQSVEGPCRAESFTWDLSRKALVAAYGSMGIELRPVR